MRIMIAAAVLLFALPAVAEDPQFGACWDDGKHCVGPRVAAPAMAVELKDGNVTWGFMPGVGYGWERNGPRLKFGLAGFISVRDTSEGQRICPAVLASLYRYVHVGPAVQLGSDRKWFMLLTLGSDLGMARATPEK